MRALVPGGALVIGDIHFDSVVWYGDRPERMADMISAWDDHFVERRVPAILPATLDNVEFTVEEIRPATTSDIDPKPDGLAIAMIAPDDTSRDRERPTHRGGGAEIVRRAAGAGEEEAVLLRHHAARHRRKEGKTGCASSTSSPGLFPAIVDAPKPQTARATRGGPSLVRTRSIPPMLKSKTPILAFRVRVSSCPSGLHFAADRPFPEAMRFR